MEINKTKRGFDLSEFKDRNGVKCSIQKSSIATQDCLWIGCDDLGLKQLVPGQGWTDVQLPDNDWVANTRMHLDRDTAARLIPALVSFALHGEMDDSPIETATVKIEGGTWSV